MLLRESKFVRLYAELDAELDSSSEELNIGSSGRHLEGYMKNWAPAGFICTALSNAHFA